MLAKSLITGGLITSALLVSAAFAAEWQTGAGISVGSYITDNACLDDSDKTTRVGGTVTPDVNLRGRGARANLSLRAAAEYNSQADSNLNCNNGRGNSQSVIPSIRFAGDLELVEDWLTLESDAYADRNPVDPFAAGSSDNLNNRDNTNITYQYGVGAVTQRRLLKKTDMRLRYRYSEQFNDVSSLGNSSEDRVEFDLGTSPASSRISTGIAGRYSKINYEGGEFGPSYDNKLSSAEARAAMQLNSTWQINGLVGQEWNEFTSARNDIDGAYWDAGLLWTPNPRVEVGVGTGERYFGTTPRLNASYRHKRSQLTASYARTLTIPRDLRTATDAFADPFGPNFDQLPGDPLPIGGEPTFFGNSPVLDERFTLRYRFAARRTSITVSASESQQTRTEDLGKATFTDIGATLSRDLASNLSANARINWSEREGQGNNVGPFGQRSQTWRFGFGFSRRLSTDTTLNLNYQFTRQESDFALNQYDENRVAVSVRHAF